MMAWKTSRFLLPLRQPMFQSRKNFSAGNGKIGPLRRLAERIKPKLQNKASNFEYKLSIQRTYVQEFCSSGKYKPKLMSRNTRSILGVSVAVGACCLPHCTYAMDGLDIMVDDYQMESFDSPEEDDRHELWMLMRKLWLPVFFLFTVFVNWDNGFTVVIRILLFLFGTKPSPSSIYLLLEKLRHGYMRQKPHLYRFKSLYASKVDIRDYKLLCIARVEIGEQKLCVIGILGGWWPLPSSLRIPFLAQEQRSGTSRR